MSSVYDSRIKHDLGTYHLKVEFEGGDGYIEEWHTGSRYGHGTGDISPLWANRIGCTWHSEQDMFETMRFMYTDGNYSCDCNRRSFLARAKQEPEIDNNECGNTLKLMRLVAIRPDGSECLLFKSAELDQEEKANE